MSHDSDQNNDETGDQNADATTTATAETVTPNTPAAEASSEDTNHGDDSDDDNDDDDGDGNRGTPRVIDEAAWAEENDDDDDDDDVPLHFAGGLDDAGGDDDDDNGDDNDNDGNNGDRGQRDVAVRHRPDLEITLNADAEIPLDLIDEDALWVVKRLRAKGFEAYLTGGCVRDLLLGRTPKDFDVATAAHPNQCRAVFRNCRLVGRRFRLAHVFFPSGKVIETATFRANPTDTLEDLPEDLLVERDNVFGSVEEDARRRDLTINGLFYDPVAGKVIDFVDGRTDLEKRLIRTIGDPEIRFQEDPVRILRVIKFATRLGFEIEEQTWAAMCHHSGELLRCAPARLQEELLRLLASTHARASWALCEKAGVTKVLLPELVDALENLGGTTAPPPSATPATNDVPHLNAEPASSPSKVQANADEDAVEEADVTPVDASATDASPMDATPTDVTPVAVDGHHDGAADSEGQSSAAQDAAQDASHDGDDDGANENVNEAPALAKAPPTPPKPLVFPYLPDGEAKDARLRALFDALDEVRKRDADITSALAFSVIVAPVWEALADDPAAFEAWWNTTSEAWIERLRFTRHDRERVPQLLQAQSDLDPTHRRGHAARSIVSRPSFRESLLLFILRLQAAEMPLDEVANWKVVAAHYGYNHTQPRFDRNRQRAAGRSPGGGDRRGRGRDRGRGRSGGGGGGGGGGRRRR